MWLSLCRLAIPFLIWLFVFRDFLFFHTNTINLDTILSYAVVKFFINNILNGVFPLWDPFADLGIPFYSLAILGLLNPIIYLIALLVKFGWNYYDAYLTYLVVNFFLGAVGFYFLAKSFIKDEGAAFLAYVLLLFSGVGTVMFTQLNMLLIFVPGVWFFCFLTRFAQRFRVGDFLALTLSSMVLGTSYMPFHFLTVWGVLTLFCLCLYWKKINRFVYDVRSFVENNFIITLICVVALAVSLVPFILYKTSHQEIVTPARHCVDKNMEECYRDTMNNELGLSYKEITNFGTLGERVSLRSLFTHLDKVSFGAEGLFYLPIICYLLLLMSAAIRLQRRAVLLILTGAVIFLISLGDATVIYPFLFKHIAFFRYFRNLFFFMIFLLPMGILLAALQFKFLAEVSIDSMQDRRVMFFTVSAVHFIFFVFLLQLTAVLTISLVTVFLSWVLFISYYFAIPGRYSSGRGILLTVLVVLALLEPLRVFYFYNRNAKFFVCELPREHLTPVFSFTRPEKEIDINCTAKNFLTYIPEFWHDMLLVDGPGTVGFPGTIGRGIFFLSKHMDSLQWNAYVQNKFMVYDQVKSFQDQEENLPSLIEAIEHNFNIVFVSNSDQPLLATFKGKPAAIPPHPQVIFQPTEVLKVSHFDVNSLRMETNFNTDKFLVYTESFNSNWKVLINGKPSKLYKANAAFKGIWLPPGHNTVYLKYQPWGGESIYIFVSLFFLLFSFYTVFWLCKEAQGDFLVEKM